VQCSFRLFSAHLRFAFDPDPLPGVTGGTIAPQQGSPCKDTTCLLDTVHRLRSIANAEACEGDPPEKSEESNVVAANSDNSRPEECRSSNLKEPQNTSSCSPRPFPASIPSNKVQPMPIGGVSTQHQQKSAVVRLSFRRRSCEGDEMTEISELKWTTPLQYVLDLFANT
jgi:hypothetical protein